MFQASSVLGENALPLRYFSVFILYSSAAITGLFFNAQEGFASLLWAPSGIALAAVWLWGSSIWPAVFLGATAVNFWAGAPLHVSITIGMGNSLEAVGACLLLRHFQFDLQKLSLRDLAVYFFGGAALPGLVSAVIGAGALSLAGAVGSFRSIFFTWWLGDFMGILIVGLLALVWIRQETPKINSWRRGTEAVAFICATLVGMYILFSDNAWQQLPLSYSIFPLIIWCATRFGFKGITLLTFMLAVVSSSATIQGIGVFAQGNLFRDLIHLQTFLAVVAVTGLFTAAIFRDREEAVSWLKTLNKENTYQLKEAQKIARLGSWEMDLKTGDINWSDELYRLYGVSPENFEITYENYMNLIHPEDRANVGALIERTLREKAEFSSNRRVILSDGAVRVLRGRGRPVLDAEGNVVKLVGTCQDITEFYEAEQRLRNLSSELEQRVAERTRKLEEANRAKDEFLAILSHELRTPLNVILGWSETLAVEEKDNQFGSMREGLETLKRNALIQKNLIDDLLDSSAIVTGKLHLEKEPIDLGKSLAQIIAAQERFAFQREIEFVFEPCKEPVWIMGDPHRIHQVFSNIISNAIKFTPPKGKITVKQTVHDDLVTIEISDTGQGMEPEFLPRVFDRFRQENVGSDRSHGGLGLGLAIAHHLVRLHSGHIEAFSKGKGQGSSFKVSFATYTGDKVIACPLPKDEPQPRLKGKQIMLIDDSPDIVDLVSLWLQKQEAKVSFAHSVHEAFQVLERGPLPELILCDIGMPGEDGYSFISRLKKSENPALRAIPVVALTAYASESEKLKILAAGFRLHLVKPVHPRLLIQSAERVLGEAASGTGAMSDGKSSPSAEGMIADL